MFCVVFFLCGGFLSGGFFVVSRMVDFLCGGFFVLWFVGELFGVRWI